MAHPMYKIDAAAKKYPNFDKALENAGAEIQGTLWNAVGETGIMRFPGKIIAAVEKGIDGSDAEKEAIMIGALLTFAPLALSEGAESGDYGVPATAVLNSVSGQDKEAPHSESAARVTVIAAIALSQSVIDMMPPGIMSAAKVAEIKTRQDAQDKLFVPFLNAPKLAALYEDAKQRTFDVLAGKRPASAKPPKPRGM